MRRGLVGKRVKELVPHCEYHGVELFPDVAAVAVENIDFVINGNRHSLHSSCIIHRPPYGLASAPTRHDYNNQADDMAARVLKNFSARLPIKHMRINQKGSRTVL